MNEFQFNFKYLYILYFYFINRYLCFAFIGIFLSVIFTKENNFNLIFMI
jgi:hypothetical protein